MHKLQSDVKIHIQHSLKHSFDLFIITKLSFVYSMIISIYRRIMGRGLFSHFGELFICLLNFHYTFLKILFFAAHYINLYRILFLDSVLLFNAYNLNIINNPMSTDAT